jgi:purine-cytosine permease-like protein
MPNIVHSLLWDFMPGKDIVERHPSAGLKDVSSASALAELSSSRRNHVQDAAASAAAEQSSQDHEDFIDAPVPAERRYGTLTMTLLWITMLTNFPMVIIGFEFYRMGFSLTQVLMGTVAGSTILVAFQFFSGYIGARTGLNYSLLMEPLFGKLGVRLICAAWLLMFIGWYALNAVLMVDAIKGLFGLSIWTPFLAVPIIAAMAINNWFGFRGVANFARYLAAPVLILWVIYAFTKAAAHTSMVLALAPGTQTFSAAIIPVLVIGNATWGNEADFFRYGKSSKMLTLLPLVASVILGTLLFPTTGWLLGHTSGASETAAFTKFMNDYTFGTPWLAILALTIGYFALNDGNLYGAINAFENIWKIKRHNAVLFLVLLAAVLAVGLTYCPNALDTLASLSSHGNNL